MEGGITVKSVRVKPIVASKGTQTDVRESKDVSIQTASVVDTNVPAVGAARMDTSVPERSNRGRTNVEPFALVYHEQPWATLTGFHMDGFGFEGLPYGDFRVRETSAGDPREPNVGDDDAVGGVAKDSGGQ